MVANSLPMHEFRQADQYVRFNKKKVGTKSSNTKRRVSTHIYWYFQQNLTVKIEMCQKYAELLNFFNANNFTNIL